MTTVPVDKLMRKPELAVVIATSHFNLSDDFKSIECQESCHDDDDKPLTTCSSPGPSQSSADVQSSALSMLRLPHRRPSSSARRVRRSSASSSAGQACSFVCDDGLERREAELLASRSGARLGGENGATRNRRKEKSKSRCYPSMLSLLCHAVV